MELHEIRANLLRLSTARPLPDVFGAAAHKFVLHPPLPETEVAAFERLHGLQLPLEYRRFLIEAGNGGAGPAYGMFSLGEHMEMRECVSFDEGEGGVGVLSAPFPHSERWNDLTGEPTEEDEADEELYQQKSDAFNERYFDGALMNGAIPIAELGCGLQLWLVLTGPEAGNVWYDRRSEYGGIEPLSAPGSERVTFLQWYVSWLEKALEKLTDAPEEPPPARKPWWRVWN
jgi:hypothetical protein